jgi:chorismate synthase
MIKFITAGESHGKGLTVIVEGFPSNLPIEKEIIDYHLKRRQMGYGRGGRMNIESDSAEIVSGIRFGKTMGSPISMFIENKDWQNWTERMETGGTGKGVEKITIPRPGHADLTGVMKYNFNDIRNSIERSSARETAARVAACSVARIFLEYFDISIGSCVESIGGVYPKDNYLTKLLENEEDTVSKGWELSEMADKSSVRVINEEHEVRIVKKIKQAKKGGDSLGGTFIIVGTGIPPGLGSYIQYDTKLDADIAHGIMSINAVKGVEVGGGFAAGGKTGSEVHDEIIMKEGKLMRRTNRAGGIEGGISNAMPIIVRGVMKPIATLMTPLKSIDLSSFEEIEARRERSDFVAVPACAVIAEGMLSWVIAKHFLHKFGGDSIEETEENYYNYLNKIEKRIKRNFRNRMRNR